MDLSDWLHHQESQEVLVSSQLIIITLAYTVCIHELQLYNVLQFFCFYICPITVYVLSLTMVFLCISPMNWWGSTKEGYVHYFNSLSPWHESLVESCLIRLSHLRREDVDKLFKEVVQNEGNKLHSLLPALIILVLRTYKTHGNLGLFLRWIDFVIALLSSMPSRVKLCFYKFTLFNSFCSTCISFWRNLMKIFLSRIFPHSHCLSFHILMRQMNNCRPLTVWS